MLLLRHAESTWNAEQRWQGWADSPLTQGGRTAAHERALRLRTEAFVAIVSSDLSRARETAVILGRRLPVAISRTTPDLREQDLGAWTGLTKAQVRQRWPERLRERPRRPVGGETVDRVVDRVLAQLITTAQTSPIGPILVVTHAGVIRELERAHGRAPTPIPHLEGRWVQVARDGRLELAEATDGRVPEAAR